MYLNTTQAIKLLTFSLELAHDHLNTEGTLKRVDPIFKRISEVDAQLWLEGWLEHIGHCGAKRTPKTKKLVEKALLVALDYEGEYCDDEEIARLNKEVEDDEAVAQ